MSPAKYFGFRVKTILTFSGLHFFYNLSNRDCCCFGVEHSSHFNSLRFAIHLLNQGFAAFTEYCISCLFSVENPRLQKGVITQSFSLECYNPNACPSSWIATLNKLYFPSPGYVFQKSSSHCQSGYLHRLNFFQDKTHELKFHLFDR